MSEDPATPSVFAFAFTVTKRDAMVLHLAYSIVVATLEVRCLERERDAVLFCRMLKKTRTRTRFWCGQALNIEKRHCMSQRCFQISVRMTF